jgi:hypothetical protein
VIELPDFSDVPEFPHGSEISQEDAQRRIEEVSQKEWGIDWVEFRRRWNSAGWVDDEGNLHPWFTQEEREHLRPLWRLIVFAKGNLSQ